MLKQPILAPSEIKQIYRSGLFDVYNNHVHPATNVVN